MPSFNLLNEFLYMALLFLIFSIGWATGSALMWMWWEITIKSALSDEHDSQVSFMAIELRKKFRAAAVKENILDNK